MESFRLSRRAERDLADLYDYIAMGSGADRANALEAEIIAAVHMLARMPGMGHRRDDLPDPSLRVWLVHRWLILYRPESVPLEVVPIVGGWQDVQSRLGGRDLD